MKTKLFKFKIKNLVFSLIFVLLALILSISSPKWRPFEGLDNKITDSTFQKKRDVAENIIIVGIDEETIEKYHAYNPVEYRGYFADILNMWADNDCIPAAIGFDVIFNNAYGCDEVDVKLRNAMNRHNVVLGVNGMSRTDAPYGLSTTV